VALAAIYNLQALLCFLIPSVIGTGLTPILLLIFAVNTLGQVSTPTESAVVPLVASRVQLASAASLVDGTARFHDHSHWLPLATGPTGASAPRSPPRPGPGRGWGPGGALVAARRR